MKFGDTDYHVRLTDVLVVLAVTIAGTEALSVMIDHFREQEQGHPAKSAMLHVNTDHDAGDSTVLGLTNKLIYARVREYGPSGPVMCVELVPWEVCGIDLEIKAFAHKVKNNDKRSGP